MYVCICNAVTEKDIEKAVDNGVLSMTALAELTLLGKDCGCCTEYAHQVLSKCSANSKVKCI